MIQFILGNIFDALSSLLIMRSMFSKSKKNMLLIQCLDCVCAIIGNLLLGGWSGAVIITYSLIRNLVCAKYTLSNSISMLFVIASGLLGVYVNDDGFFGLFSVIGTIEYTAFVCFSRKANTLRIGMLINLILYVFYSVAIKSYVVLPIYITIMVIIIIKLYKGEEDLGE